MSSLLPASASAAAAGDAAKLRLNQTCHAKPPISTELAVSNIYQALSSRVNEYDWQLHEQSQKAEQKRTSSKV